MVIIKIMEILIRVYQNLILNLKSRYLKEIPTSPVNFSEDQLNDIEKMLDKMEDDEDVQYVFTNIA